MNILGKQDLFTRLSCRFPCSPFLWLPFSLWKTAQANYGMYVRVISDSFSLYIIVLPHTPRRFSGRWREWDRICVCTHLQSKQAWNIVCLLSPIRNTLQTNQHTHRSPKNPPDCYPVGIEFEEALASCLFPLNLLLETQISGAALEATNEYSGIESLDFCAGFQDSLEHLGLYRCGALRHCFTALPVCD